MELDAGPGRAVGIRVFYAVSLRILSPAALTQSAAGMFFNGAHAVAANNNQLVGLYSPTTWIDGSSVSHLDTDNPAYGGMMMLHAVGTGNAARDYSAIEVGMMQDLGYTAVTAVPSRKRLRKLTSPTCQSSSCTESSFNRSDIVTPAKFRAPSRARHGATGRAARRCCSPWGQPCSA